MLSNKSPPQMPRRENASRSGQRRRVNPLRAQRHVRDGAAAKGPNDLIRSLKKGRRCGGKRYVGMQMSRGGRSMQGERAEGINEPDTRGITAANLSSRAQYGFLCGNQNTFFYKLLIQLLT